MCMLQIKRRKFVPLNNIDSKQVRMQNPNFLSSKLQRILTFYCFAFSYVRRTIPFPTATYPNLEHSDLNWVTMSVSIVCSCLHFFSTPNYIDVVSFSPSFLPTGVC